MLTPSVIHAYMNSCRGDAVVACDSTGELFIVVAAMDDFVVLEYFESVPPVRINVDYQTLEEQYHTPGWAWSAYATP